MRVLIYLFIGLISFTACKTKKKAVAHKEENVAQETVVREEVAPDFTIQKATYIYKKGGIRTVGNVYSFVIKVIQEDVSVDSVWFGGLPVLADVYDNASFLRHKGAMTIDGEYLIEANENLYRNFYPNIDSTEVARTFVAPMKFQGEAIIFYKQYGVRKYVIVNDAEYLGKKSYR